MNLENLKVAVLGLGYVGLPVAVGFAENFKDTIGFDINAVRIADLKRHHDHTLEVSEERLKAAKLHVTDTVEDMAHSNLFIACIPTPINDNKEPDLEPLHKACKSIAKILKKGDIVVFESTVYPGVTEEVCGPWLAEYSGLIQSVDFKLGYSPERINPGDPVNKLETINKVVAGEDDETSDILCAAYGKIVTGAEIHRAKNIKVAEMSKVIENTQRDVNVALINEIAIICERLNIRTQDVLAASRTKWNFLPFTPGLVGGHCIGVDPYYLTAKAEKLGHHPEVILSGRRINDNMGRFIANKTIKMLIKQCKPMQNVKLGIMGITFKENVGDIRNSKVPDIIRELKEFNIDAFIHDPYANPEEVKHEYGLTLAPLEDFKDLDCLIFAVGHNTYSDIDFSGLLKDDGIIIDVKSRIDEESLKHGQAYWSL